MCSFCTLTFLYLIPVLEDSSFTFRILIQEVICCREICKKDGKQESAIVKPPPDAPPFSEEWLAAFEAAGEVIKQAK